MAAASAGTAASAAAAVAAEVLVNTEALSGNRCNRHSVISGSSMKLTGTSSVMRHQVQ